MERIARWLSQDGSLASYYAAIIIEDRLIRCLGLYDELAESLERRVETNLPWVVERQRLLALSVVMQGIRAGQARVGVNEACVEINNYYNTADRAVRMKDRTKTYELLDGLNVEDCQEPYAKLALSLVVTDLTALVRSLESLSCLRMLAAAGRTARKDRVRTGRWASSLPDLAKSDRPEVDKAVRLGASLIQRDGKVFLRCGFENKDGWLQIVLGSSGKNY